MKTSINKKGFDRISLTSNTQSTYVKQTKSTMISVDK